MKPSDIQVGRTYRGYDDTARVQHKVVAFCGVTGMSRSVVDAISVEYREVRADGTLGHSRIIWLESFARWAGSEVQDES